MLDLFGERTAGVVRVVAYVIAPPSGGYRWERWTFDNTKPLPIPPGLMPREREQRATPARPVRPTNGLDRYAEKALADACRKIMMAPAGEQEATINGECFSIGTAAGAGLIATDFARRTLIWAASQVRDYDPRRPWRGNELANKVNRAFDDGLQHPREVRHVAR